MLLFSLISICLILILKNKSLTPSKQVKDIKLFFRTFKFKFNNTKFISTYGANDWETNDISYL